MDEWMDRQVDGGSYSTCLISACNLCAPVPLQPKLGFCCVAGRQGFTAHWGANEKQYSQTIIYPDLTCNETKSASHFAALFCFDFHPSCSGTSNLTQVDLEGCHVLYPCSLRTLLTVSLPFSKVLQSRQWSLSQSCTAMGMMFSVWYTPRLCPGKMGISQDLTGDEEGREVGGERQPALGLAVAQAELDVIYTLPTSGSGGRRSNHYLPPESCPSHVAQSVGFHIKMDPLLLQHPTSAAQAPAPSFQRCFSDEKQKEARQGMSRRWWLEKSKARVDQMAVTISCQNIKSSTRALLWQDDSPGCITPSAAQMETDTKWLKVILSSF